MSIIPQIESAEGEELEEFER